MNDFLNKIVSCIVETPENFKIVQEKEDNIDVYTILVAEKEFGKLIGKEGKTINAIRTLCRLKSAQKTQNQQKVFIKVDKLLLPA